MAKRDYYEVLGVARDASEKEIKKAYRQLAKKYHPDMGEGAADEERFKEATEAYEVLSDPNQRAQYDRFGHTGPEQGFDFGEMDFRRAREAFDEFGFGRSAFDDLFDMFFGQGMGRSRTQGRTTQAQRGEDLEYRLKINLEDAASGTKMKVTVPRYERCSRCEGTGAEPGHGVTRCPQCDGRGQVEYRQNTLLGSFINVQICPDCGGSGEVVEVPCKRCHGEGRVKKKDRISITIPAGVADGSRLRLRKRGNTGRAGGPPGDLYIVTEIAPHPTFTRSGDDITCEVSIQFTQAALGDTIQVPTLNGQRKLHIPSGTQSGVTFKLRGEGIPHLQRRGKGDQYVVVRIITPKKLTSKQQKLLQELAQALEEGK
ncbi:MAG: molecular chaperone DnaJ [Candidatus Bipolaricaulia bacterium]